MHGTQQSVGIQCCWYAQIRGRKSTGESRVSGAAGGGGNANWMCAGPATERRGVGRGTRVLWLRLRTGPESLGSGSQERLLLAV